jgi:hypothetical protein
VVAVDLRATEAAGHPARRRDFVEGAVFRRPQGLDNPQVLEFSRIVKAARLFPLLFVMLLAGCKFPHPPPVPGPIQPPSPPNTLLRTASI